MLSLDGREGPDSNGALRAVWALQEALRLAPLNAHAAALLSRARAEGLP